MDVETLLARTVPAYVSYEAESLRLGVFVAFTVRTIATRRFTATSAHSQLVFMFSAQNQQIASIVSSLTLYFVPSFIGLSIRTRKLYYRPLNVKKSWSSFANVQDVSKMVARRPLKLSGIFSLRLSLLREILQICWQFISMYIYQF